MAFPTTPTDQEIYNGYKWNGELWEVYNEPEIGQVVQAITHKFQETGAVSANTSETALPGWTKTFTKKYSNSLILCTANFYAYYASSPSYWSILAYANGSPVSSATTGSLQSYLNNSVFTHNSTQYLFGTGAHQAYSFNFFDTTNTSEITFTFSAITNAGTINIWADGGPTFSYLEVKQ